MDALIVVAHPDDEVIWAGGLVLRHSDWNWHIVSLCRGDDPDRRPRFFRSVEILGTRGSISDLDDSSPTLAPLSLDLSEIKYRIRTLAASSCDLIVTHGPDGEYTDHPRHEQVHRAVWEMAASGELSGMLYCFAYRDCDGKCAPEPVDDADVYIRLTHTEHARKLEIVRDIYGFDEWSFEYQAAGPMEAFYCVSGAPDVTRVRQLSGDTRLGG